MIESNEAEDADECLTLGERCVASVAHPSVNLPRDPDPNQRLTAQQLREHARQLSLLSTDHAKRTYSDEHERCRLDPGYIPNPEAVQRLVSAWRVLWRHRNDKLIQAERRQAREFYRRLVWGMLSAIGKGENVGADVSSLSRL